MSEMRKQETDGRGEFAVLWTKAQPAVMAFIRSCVHDFHDSEDVLQQVAEAVYSQFDEYDDSRPFVPWAITIAKYKILEYRRAKSRVPHRIDDQALRDVSEAFGDMDAHMDAMREALEKCLRKVVGRSRMALQMRYIREMKPAQIAEAMDVSANLVSVLLHRVRESLRKCIETYLAKN